LQFVAEHSSVPSEQDGLAILRLVMLTQNQCNTKARFYLYKNRTSPSPRISGSVYYECEILLTNTRLNTRAGEIIAGTADFVATSEIRLKTASDGVVGPVEELECFTSVTVDYLEEDVVPGTAGCNGTCALNGTPTTESRVFSSPVTLIKGYEDVSFGKISTTCGGSPQTWAELTGCDWIFGLGNTFAAASVTKTNGVTDNLILAWTVAKTSGRYIAGQKVACSFGTGTNGATGCTADQYTIISVTYNNTVSCT